MERQKVDCKDHCKPNHHDLAFHRYWWSKNHRLRTVGYSERHNASERARMARKRAGEPLVCKALLCKEPREKGHKYGPKCKVAFRALTQKDYRRRKHEALNRLG